jgi:hypothetical protein
MKLTKGKISKLYRQNKQTFKRGKNGRFEGNKSFRKKGHVNLKNKTLKGGQGVVTESNLESKPAEQSLGTKVGLYRAKAMNSLISNSMAANEKIKDMARKTSTGFSNMAKKISSSSPFSKTKPSGITEENTGNTKQSPLYTNPPEDEVVSPTAGEQEKVSEDAAKPDTATDVTPEAEIPVVEEVPVTPVVEEVPVPPVVEEVPVPPVVEEVPVTPVVEKVPVPPVVEEVPVPPVVEEVPTPKPAAPVTETLPPVLEEKKPVLETTTINDSHSQEVSNAAKILLDYAIDSISKKINSGVPIKSIIQNPEEAFTGMTNAFANARGGGTKRLRTRKIRNKTLKH